MQSMAFPLRLGENGVLRRQDQAASMIEFLQVMARTPAGSWPGCPAFGLRDLLERGRQRADIPQLAADRINQVFLDLGLADFSVEEIVREVSANPDIDAYAVTLVRGSARETFTTVVRGGDPS